MKKFLWILVYALAVAALAQTQYKVVYKNTTTPVAGITVNQKLLLEVKAFAKAIAATVTVDTAKKQAVFKKGSSNTKVAVLMQKNLAFASLSDMALGLRLIPQPKGNTITIFEMPSVPAPQANVPPPPPPTPTPAAANSSASSQYPKSYQGTFTFSSGGFVGHGEIVFKSDGAGSYRSASGKLILDTVPDPFNANCTKREYKFEDGTGNGSTTAVLLFPMAGRFTLGIDSIVCPDGGEGAGGLPIQLRNQDLENPDPFGVPAANINLLEGKISTKTSTLQFRLIGQ